MYQTLKLAPSLTYPCGPEEQTTDGILQGCPLHQLTRQDVWLTGTTLRCHRDNQTLWLQTRAAEDGCQDVYVSCYEEEEDN